MRRDLCTNETGASVKTHSCASCGAVHLDTTRIWLEICLRILGCDTTLDGRATCDESVLRQAKVAECRARRNLNLARDDIDTGNFLRNSVFDLQTWIDFDKVVSVLLVDKKLGRACITVTGCLGDLHSIL